MCKCKNLLSRRLMALALIVLGVYVWYTFLDEDHKRFIRNILSQIPDLPGRYMV